jgi:hypothetical protein
MLEDDVRRIARLQSHFGGIFDDGQTITDVGEPIPKPREAPEIEGEKVMR